VAAAPFSKSLTPFATDNKKPRSDRGFFCGVLYALGLRTMRDTRDVHVGPRAACVATLALRASVASQMIFCRSKLLQNAPHGSETSA
jgi:hypothetical protein